MIPRELVSAKGFATPTSFNSEAWSRNLGLLSSEEQLKISQFKVGIPGLGGVGGSHLITLLRTGFNKFHLADFDTFEVANFNRQHGAKISNLGQAKIDVMTKEAYDINPYAELKLFPTGLNTENIEHFLDGIDLVVDSLDFFALDTRRLLFKRAREKGIPVVTAGPIAFGVSFLIFLPNEGISFEEFGAFTEFKTPDEQFLAFGMALTPNPSYMQTVDRSKIRLADKKGPSLGLSCQLCSGIAACEALKILLKKGKVYPAPYYNRFDALLGHYFRGYLRNGNRSLKQRIKFFIAKKLLFSRKNKSKLSLAPAIPITDAPSREIISSIVECAVLAPSGDNSQHWRFKWDGKRLRLINDIPRAEFFYSVEGEPIFLSWGAVIENIKIAASHYGLDAKITYSPNLKEQKHIADIVFVPRKLEEDTLFQHLPERCCNRGFYSTKSLEKISIAEMEKEVHSFSKVSLTWIESKSPQAAPIIKASFLSDSMIWKHKKLHEDLFRWLTLNSTEVEHGDGMNLNVLGVPTPMHPLFKIVRNFSWVSFLNYFGFSYFISLTPWLWMQRSAAYCFITIKDELPETYLDAGRAMVRVWTRANSLGISAQPMSSAGLMLLHLKKTNLESFSKNQISQIQKIKQLYKSVFPEEVSYGMLLRMGYSKPPKFRSPRRNVAAFLSFE